MHMKKRGASILAFSVAVGLLISFSTAYSGPALADPAAAGTASARDFRFTHPGMLYTKADLDRMRAAVTNHVSPAAEELQQMQANPLASSSYPAKFDAVVYRNDAAHGNTGDSDLQGGASAALFNALEWYITRDKSYADEAVSILNGWSGTLTSIQRHDAQLAAALYGYKYLNAAEILRYGGADWSGPDMAVFSSMMQTCFYSLTQGFGYVNGGWANGNWDAATVVFNLCYGVWSNDKTVYDAAVDYLKNGAGNGRISTYIQNAETGQVQEAGRDQSHCQGGISLLAQAVQIGWTQRYADRSGADLYSYPNNEYLVLKGIEYTAKYNLGYDVPYTPIPPVGYTLDDMAHDSWLPGLTVSTKYRGLLRPIYQQAYNFYHNDIGVSDNRLTYTKEAVDRMGGYEPFVSDSPSYGGLIDDQNGSNRPSSAVASSNTIIALENTYAYLHSAAYTGSAAAADAMFAGAADTSSAVTVTGTDNRLATDFDLVFLRSNQYAFKSLLTGKYLSVQDDGTVLADGISIDAAQTFVFADTGNTNITIQSVLNKKYLQMDPASGRFMANSAVNNNDYCRWYILYPQDTGVSSQALQSAVSTFLSNGLIDSRQTAGTLINALGHKDLARAEKFIRSNARLDIAAARYLHVNLAYLTAGANTCGKSHS